MKKNNFSGELYLTGNTIKFVVGLLEAATYVKHCSFSDENGNSSSIKMMINGGLCVQKDTAQKPRLIKKEKLENYIRFLVFKERKRNLSLSVSSLK